MIASNPQNYLWRNATRTGRILLSTLVISIASTAVASEPEVESPSVPIPGNSTDSADYDNDPIESAEEMDDFDDLLALDESIDLLFEDFDIVISASRSEQSSNMTPVPVSILSADDIKYSGVSELPELLAFIPGVDALQLDRNRWAIGVRGLHQTFSDRTLFLLNGRTISNPVHGGVDFQRLPIFLDDIK